MWGSVLEWRPADGHLLYVGIDRGYKSGGFGLGGVGEYGPEKHLGLLGGEQERASSTGACS